MSAPMSSRAGESAGATRRTGEFMSWDVTWVASSLPAASCLISPRAARGSERESGARHGEVWRTPGQLGLAVARSRRRGQIRDAAEGLRSSPVCAYVARMLQIDLSGKTAVL